MINQVLINKYCQNFDIKSYLHNFDIDFQETQTNFILNECLYCGKSNKMNINKKLGIFYCYRCGEKGNLFGLMSLVENISKGKVFWREVKNIENGGKYQKNISFHDLRKFDKESVKDEYNYKFDEVELFSDFRKIDFNNINSEEVVYLRGRGINKEMVKFFNLFYSPYYKRIIFPFYWGKKIIGWQGRDITGTNPYKLITYPKGFNRKNFLFNYDKINKNKKYITIVEGPVDCVKSYKFNSIALLGSSLSSSQVNLLFQLKKLKGVFLAIDPEEDVKRHKIYNTLSPFFKVYDVSILPEGCDDIGDCSEKQIAESILKASTCQDVGMRKL